MNETKKTATVSKLISDVNAAAAAARQAEQKLADAGLDLMKQVGAAAALTRGDRRARTSAASHVEQLLERGGQVDLEKFQRDLEERPHLWAATKRALHRVERELIIDGWWRNGQPAEEDNLRRAASGYSLEDDTALSAELSRAGYNGFHLVALSFRRAGVNHPDLFGTLTREEEARAHDEALALVAEASKALRSSPVLVASACESYNVQQRPGVDPVPDLVEAAAAAASRGLRG